MDPELQKIVDAENKRNRAELERTERRLTEARKEASRLAREIGKADPAVRKVILFGSVATGFRKQVEKRGEVLYDAEQGVLASRPGTSNGPLHRGG